MNRTNGFLLCIFFILASLLAPSRSPGKAEHAERGAAKARVSVKEDENLVFFPSYACRDPRGEKIIVKIHAWIHEPERDSVKRRVMIDFLRGQLGLAEGEEKSAQFRERALAFLAGQESFRRVSVSLGGTVYDLGRTGGSGHLEKEISVPASSLPALVGRDGWIAYGAAAKKNEGRTFRGKSKFLSDSGVLVVSDIDDTIKVSEVRDRKRLIRNTFVNDFQAVPGMAAEYSRWSSRGADFHYVSASPWQLHAVLSDFLKRSGFPAGFFQMKHFGLPADFLTLFQSPEKFKTPYLCGLVRKFSRRKFILVGDSGEKDPEIYGDVARKCPGRIACIFIRNITDEDRGSERMKKAFSGLGAERVIVFRNPEELRAADIFR